MTARGLSPRSSVTPRFALSLATLSAVGFSMVLCAQLAWMQLETRSDYTLSNVLGGPLRNKLLLSLAAGIVLPALAGIVVPLLGGERGFFALQRVAQLLAPLALSFLVPALFLSSVAESKPLFYLVMLSAFGLAMRSLVARSLAIIASDARPTLGLGSLGQRAFRRVNALRLPLPIALAFVGLAATAFALILGRNAIAHHHLIQTLDTDIGIADNVMANLSLGRGFRAPALFGTLPGNYLTVHADYIALLFTPIYRRHPGPETLLWLQAGLAGLSVVPLFFLARRLLGQRMAIWASLAFMSLAPLHGALLYGVSWLPALCLSSFTLYYALIAERSWLIALAVPFVLASSEGGPLCVLVLGLVAIGELKQVRVGIALCVLGSLVFGLNALIAVHAGGSTGAPPLLAALAVICANPVYFILDLARFSKVSSMLHALAPFALLPLTSIGGLPLLLPALLFTSASTEFWPASHSAYPYALLWIPGCIFAVLLALRKIREAPGRRPLYVASVITMTLTLLSHSYNFGALLSKDGFSGSSVRGQFEATPATDKRYADLRSLVRRIPPAGSVVTTTYMLSHVSSRADVFDARRPYGEPDYVFFSTLELVGGVRESLITTFASHNYSLTASAGEFYLFRRGVETEATTQALRALGLIRDASLSGSPASANPVPTGKPAHGHP